MAKTQALRVISSRKMYEGPVFQVFSDRVQEPDGVTARRDVVRHSGSVVVMAVDRPKRGETRVLLIRQYRYVVDRTLWELPAGRVDEGESMLAAAKRELREETGVTARHWKRALRFWVSPGFLDETMDIFLAEGLSRGTAEPEEDERIIVRFFPLSEAVEMVMSGRIRDAKTIAGLLWLDRKIRKI